MRNKPMYFIQNKPAAPGETKTPWFAIYGWAFMFVSMTIATIFALGVGGRLIAYWDDIKFAYDKPAMVRVVRQQYESQVKKVDTTFVVTPTPQPTVTVTPTPTTKKE